MDEWELYDLENDPNEMNNIYKSASDKLISDLKAQLKAYKLNTKTILRLKR